MTPPQYFGPYRVEKQLGRGGMGIVYRAVHDKSNEPVAVKVISAAVADSERFRRRFYSEIETLKKLDHPNIVRIIGWGEERGDLFYVMEVVDGPSLQQHLRSVRRMNWSEVIRLAIEVTSALKHAHDVGVIHRDLKPANLLLPVQGGIKLLDFGIAKLFGATHVTLEGAVMGTADFMAPEQADSTGVTQRTDLYALGSVMYACLAGRSPFGGRQLTAVLHSLKHDAPPPLDLINPDVPAELVELINELLAKDPADRPPTAIVVSNRLRSMQIGLKNRIVPDEPSIADRMTLPEQGTVVGAPSEPSRSKSREPRWETSLSASGASEPPSTEREKQVRVKTASHYREIEEHERRRAATPITGGGEEPPRDATFWLSVLGLVTVLLVLIGVAWWMLQPVPPEQLYGRVLAARERGDYESMRQDGELFLYLYPGDAHEAEVRDALESEQRDASLRRLMTRFKRQNSGKELNPAESALIEILQSRQTDPLGAHRRLEQWLTIFGGERVPESTMKQWAELAKSTLAQWQREDASYVDERAAELHRWIDWGERNITPENKLPFYQSIVDLFQDKPWATEPVDRARKLAEKSLSSGSSMTP